MCLLSERLVQSVPVCVCVFYYDTGQSLCHRLEVQFESDMPEKEFETRMQKTEQVGK